MGNPTRHYLLEFRDRLRIVSSNCGALPRTRSTPGFSIRRDHHGAAPVGANGAGWADYAGVGVLQSFAQSVAQDQALSLLFECGVVTVSINEKWQLQTQVPIAISRAFPHRLARHGALIRALRCRTLLAPLLPDSHIDEE